MTDPLVASELLIALGDGDTDPERVYIQQADEAGWVCFPVKHIETVIAALRAVQHEYSGE